MLAQREPKKPITKDFFNSVMEIFHGDSNIRVFHVRKKMMNNGKTIFRPILSENDFKDACDETKAIYDHFMAIDGIEAVCFDKYRVVITKAKAYDWVEIMPQISIILLERF